MASKYELALAKDYVPEWTIVDAVREFFQNALDQEATMEDNKMFFKYDPAKKILVIGNKSSVLSTESLLLGTSTKRDDDKTIGKFGEGYKVATLVALREDKNITIYNYGARQVWKPRFVKARRYNNAEVLTFFVDNKFPWTHVPDNNLTIVIEGINEIEYKDIVKSNLHLQDVGDTIVTEYGEILLGDKYSGQVYVNGLYVCRHDDYMHGYNFKPDQINLDRDRKLVSDFDLKWLGSKMWAVAGNPDKAIELAKMGAADVAFLSSMEYVVGSNYSDIVARAFEEFMQKYGPNAKPVTTQAEIETLDKQHNPIVVNESFYKLVTASPDYKTPKLSVRASLSDRIKEWKNKWAEDIPADAVDELEKIIEEDLPF